MKILIADDEKFIREELKSTIERIHPGNSYHFAKNFDTALEEAKNNEIDIAFLDIRMPGKTGLELARAIRIIKPDVNIIIVTAYADYALEALRLYVSGYILKPFRDKDIEDALDNLRKPLSSPTTHLKKSIRAQCFGNFELFFNNKPITFSRQKEKEMLAYLICLNGSSASRGEICAYLFEDEDSEEKNNNYLKKIIYSLRKDLSRLGIEGLLTHSRNSYSVNTEMIECDYYAYLSDRNRTNDRERFREGFMNQYSWAEMFKCTL